MFFKEHKHSTDRRFEEIEHYETFIKFIDLDYLSVAFVTYGTHRLSVLYFTQVKRKEYGKGTEYKEDIVEVP